MTQPQNPSVSVVIPTYNDARGLADALDSIVAQTTPPAEIVVADDGSEDCTEQLVREFAEHHTGAVDIRYVRLPERSGSAAARNTGVAAARGEWIAVCDSDDMWLPAKLERQLEFLREWNGEPIAILGTFGYNVNEAGKVISPLRIGPTSEVQYRDARARGAKLVVLHSSAIYPRREFDAIGGYSTEYGSLDDIDFVCRMAGRGVVICMPEPLVHYRKRSGSKQLAHFWEQRENAWRLAENEVRKARGEALISREEFAARLAAAPAWRRLRRRKRLWGLYYYRAGATDMVNGRRLRGAAQLALAWMLDGRRFRAGVANRLRSRTSQATRAQPADLTVEAASPARRRA